jgi:hypothetical protein
VGEGRR